MNASYSVPLDSKPIFTVHCGRCGNTQPIETQRMSGAKRQERGKRIFISEDHRDGTILVGCHFCGAEEYI